MNDLLIDDMMNGVAVSNNGLVTKDQVTQQNFDAQSEKKANMLKLEVHEVSEKSQATPIFDKFAKVESKSNKDFKPFRKNTLDMDH